MGNMKYKGSNLPRPLRYLYLRFIRMRGSAEEVSRGMALGIFIGMTPTMGVQMPIALFFAMLFKENKIAAILGVWISNPVTVIPIYTFNFQVGKYLLGTRDVKMPQFSSFNEIIELSYDFLLPLTIGSLLTGIVTAAIAYVVTLYTYRGLKYEKDLIKRKREEKKHDREIKEDK